ncbi:2-succinyl-5-enolpyruvyl-6-hydroxy-3-cyclohexene-1-carboxylic-acid synthase [Aquiflexum gelatinilyticum]|uniref:2-succinyl-5-enolpyruvyl-6-hydroxy-3-cyclohexene-1-carboxylate synthase n=1 Tax=Aquiflexum gelatinilyticum TaxID=2961943 RepID=A0A9X2P7P3_9BACT|nr:2-succinyl-5-enolpyruvyl-6-hydroxy-3-cyclohexene-1-carboxylic-acid synthase [Aquiflexum gelatinilyticum]MCR9013720.1 2-succinyl-5-enolpyruvyl-6-hydroxy-3-cyclohexene-1-carboxylic-acid synthase [Aquiflexum gelatinilyticum]
MVLQPIIDIASVCALKGIKNAILSPGSRCAPITLSFSRHPDINCKTISDERSAAFIALGMAQQLEQPVVLVCTSGSAAYNYAPAIAEAFFQQVPLIVITADRPPEWIDQWDGQTIRQTEIYGKHVKGFFQFPDEFGHPDKVWHANRIMNEAINLSNQFPAGPVHINIPLREPFYPENSESFDFSKTPRIIEPVYSKADLSEKDKQNLISSLSTFKKILIVPGQQKPDAAIQNILDKLVRNGNAVVVADTISNMQSDDTINYHDHFVGNGNLNQLLNPDIVLTFGKSIISKNLKIFLRNSKAEHWHIQPAGYVPDTYRGLTKIIHCQVLEVLNLMNQTLKSEFSFVSSWKKSENTVQENFDNILENAEFGEYRAISTCLKAIPPSSKIHLANSMAVRYVNFFGKREHEIFCNRGTSGIDGSNSTAIGCAFAVEEFVTLVTGDMAFFYDRNAFWHNYRISNLRIILLNNHAGGIFRLIEGPSKQPELEEYFETNQKLDGKSLAHEFGFGYHISTNMESLKIGLVDFYTKSDSPKILEIQSESSKNAEILKWVKSKINELF